MLYLISSTTIIKKYLKFTQLKEVEEMDDLRRAFFHSIYRYLTSYNADFLITFSNLRKDSKSYSNHTKKNSEEVLEKNILQICNYKKKNFDIFIVESSKKKFAEVETKLSSITQKFSINFDSSTLTVEHLRELKYEIKNDIFWRL